MTRNLVLSVTLKDCEVQTKRGHGKGGQNRNKRDTAVRVVHRPSGAVGESQEERSQHQNKRTAFTRMIQTKEFTTWLKVQLGHVASTEALLKDDMSPENLLVEVRKGGQWVKA